MPDKVKVVIEETLHWIDDKEFLYSKNVTISGLPICDNTFEIVDLANIR